MPSVLALRALLGAGLGLGALDVVWINAALAPRLIEHAPAPRPAAVVASPPPVVTPIEEAPPPPPPPVEATVTSRVYFATGSPALDTRARKALADLVRVAPPAARWVLDGHADYRGAESFNTSLSKDRALAVQRALARLGIDLARVEVDYNGEAQPSTELWRDRRVDIHIIGGTR